jgi:hypothetical protein
VTSRPSGHDGEHDDEHDGEHDEGAPAVTDAQDADAVPAAADDEHDGEERPASGFDAWRRRSAAGEVGTAIARGLGAVFAPTENKPVVSAPIPGDPPDPAQGFRVHLDPDDPSKSVALFSRSDVGEDDRPAADEPGA